MLQVFGVFEEVLDADIEKLIEGVKRRANKGLCDSGPFTMDVSPRYQTS